ncbi:DUF1800 domain-containing protein [Erythrobacter donghaensis]|uniref:DUF1800 domain-containing protein n=1 Tax=Erythrobacter donghaensis TaxID=267135 RepID=UPI001B800F39|nr:DUF1800 domain-containing protein [Erythrobacter donghaensis]
MTPASIAINRFGYGHSASGPVPNDPKRWLLRQRDAFDPAPPVIAGRMDTRAKTGEMIELVRNLRQDTRALAAMEGAEAPAMAGPMGDAMTADNPRAAALAGLPPEYREKLIDARRVLVDDIAARVNLAVTSKTPLAERLVHFWANHFSVSVGKLGTQFEVGPHEFTAIRPHVFGRFGDMLKAAVLHPAMLIYLDQFQSIGPNAPFTQRRARRGGDAPQRPRGLNENLAREVLELHTLGVDGGYSQTDVTELARALTGWTVPGIGRAGRFAETQDSGAAFVALVHEPGARQVLGRSYSAGEARQALAILDDLAAHPATARHVATKFARHFAGDTPPPALVARLEADFLKTGGDLASLTATLIDAPEAWTAQPVKFRTPFEWLVATLRLTGVKELPTQRIVGALAQLGQAPWRAPSPAGYDDLAASWAGPDALIRRVEFAERVSRAVPADNVVALAEAAFPGALTEPTLTQLKRAESGSQALALLLVSPEMMRR